MFVHGMCKTPEYQVWVNLRNRCLNSKCPTFRYYGGRGIMVCERWAVFENFYADMGPRPEGMSLDRVDNDGHYEPSNCEWTTALVQSINRGRYSNNTSGVPGVSWDSAKSKWRAEFRKTNLGRFASKIDAETAYKRAKETALNANRHG